MARRNILRIVTVNDVYELGNLSRLRSLVDKWRGEHSGPWRRLMTTLSFEKIDIDGDGTLTREEIQRALEQVQGVQVAQVRT